MNLKKIIDRLFNESRGDSLRGLRSSAESERIIQQAYEGRYLFELIQNVRDANKEIEANGDVNIVLNAGILSIANSGAEFSEEGIEGITTIGQSTKHSQDFIGYKGIGFKSVQEITDTPRIVTKHGTVQFDRNSTVMACPEREFTVDSVPLFFFPHYLDERLTTDEIKQGYVTKIELPLKSNLSENSIVRAYQEIGHRQLVLLGNISQLIFTYEGNVNKLKISRDRHIVEVHSTYNVNSKFRFFSPFNKITLPDELINSLPSKEKEVFSSSTAIDVSVVLELDENGRCNPVVDSKLYVFYPLKISSGFRFIIHSYFVVNPERTALRSSKVNDYLLSSIGKFIANEVLRDLKKSRVNTTKMLCFKRHEDSQLGILYDEVVNELMNKSFIYDSRTRKYLKPSEIILANSECKSIFPSGYLAGKHLIFSDDKEINSWLKIEFDVQILVHNNIADEIEKECKDQLKHKNISFFQDLYNYVSQHQYINLMEKKVLLTDNWKLVTSNEDVFYGGNKKNNVELPSSIRKHINFIHQDIKIADFRDGKSRTGITEFNTFELIRRLLKLFDKPTVPNVDILVALYKLAPGDVRSKVEIQKKILLPVKESQEWLSPITSPIYIENDKLRELYPEGFFVDDQILVNEQKDDSPISSLDFFKMFGAWTTPALYINESRTSVDIKEKRDRILAAQLELSSRPFDVWNDRVLDKPLKYNAWFKSLIIENWDLYETYLNSTFLPTFSAASSQSSRRNFNSYCHKGIYGAIESLKTESWIVFNDDVEDELTINDVVGIDPFEHKQPHNKVISKYLRLLPIKFNFKQGFASNIGLLHLDGDTIENYQKLLTRIYKQYENDIRQEQSFIDFYNRILGKLYSYSARYGTEGVEKLKSVKFLAIDAIKEERDWAEASEIYYIDDKLGYDLLPTKVKEKVQPHFTSRNKNTFGTVAKEIGKRFTRQISRELVQINKLETYQLSNYFEWLSHTVALFETYIARALSDDEILSIKNAVITEVNELMIGVKIGESETENSSILYYVDDEPMPVLYIMSSGLEGVQKPLSSALNEMFSNVVKRDTQSFKPQLLSFIISQEKAQYLKDFDIEANRISEIQNELDSKDYTPEQLFWESILNVKQVSTRDELFENNSVDIDVLSELINVTKLNISEFRDDFDFSKLNRPEHIANLHELFSVLDISLLEFNNEHFPKIDFCNFYNQKLIKLKDSFESIFQCKLYESLRETNAKEQSTFQDIMDQYRDFQCQSPENTLLFDVERNFIASLNDSFNSLFFSIDDLGGLDSPFDSVSLYKSGLSEFESKLSGTVYSSENLLLFLSNNTRRSLLYFNQYEPLIAAFNKFIKDKNESDKPNLGDDGFESVFDSAGDGAYTNLEEIETTGVDPSNNPGKGGGSGGGRYDGGGSANSKINSGVIAEKIVFEKLKSQYDNVKWMSKFATKIPKEHPGYNPEGLDGLGYDIEYNDNDGNKVFVEVKGRSDSTLAFEISKNEIDKALEEKERYKLMLVAHVMDKQKRAIKDLGNIFTVDNDKSFFQNANFTAFYKNFEIRFKEK